MSGFATGTLFDQLLQTVQRMLLGWLLASLIGIVIGALIGLSKPARAYLGPTLEFLRPLPASAVIPLGIAFFGLSDGMDARRDRVRRAVADAASQRYTASPPSSRRSMKSRACCGSRARP